ncbi:MFS transporter, partial [Streptomyces sp. MZ04]
RGPGPLVDGYATAFWVAAALLAAAALATAVLHRAPARLRPAQTYTQEETSKNLGDDVDPGVSRSTHG